MKLLYRNLWYIPTQILGDFLANNMGFSKQLPKTAKPKISIQQKNPFQQGTHHKTYCAGIRIYGEHSHVTFLGVPHFELVHEEVKVKLNSVDLTELRQGFLVTKIYDNFFILLTGSIISIILFCNTGMRTQSGLGEELRKCAHYICYIRKYMLISRIRYWDHVCVD